MVCYECGGRRAYPYACQRCLGTGYISMPRALFTPDIALSAIAGALIAFAFLLASITGWG